MTGSWGPPDDEGWERSSIEFAFYHSLVDDDPATVAPALLALGRIAACWSRMEHHLDALIIQVNKPEHSEELFEQHPISFGNKINLLKKWFNRYPPLASDKEDMRFLTSRLKILANGGGNRLLTRNILMHAIPASYDAATGNLVLHHMQFVGDQIVSRHITFTLDALADFAKGVQLANDLLGHITRELFTPEGYARLQKP